MKNSLLTNRYTVCYAAAILLHLLLLLSIEPVGRLIEAADVVVTIPEPDPLVFEFVESNAENDKNPPEETRLLSDRNATSRDRSRADLERSVYAYNEGVFRSKDAFETRTGESMDRTQEPGMPGEARRPGEEGASDQDWPEGWGAERLKRQGQLTQDQREEAVYGVPVAVPASTAFDNTGSRALEEGGLQLSTYDWEFAPYLKYLKRRIQSHIFPPAAFSRLGIIEGKNTLRFRIHIDGTLQALTVLAPGGSELLLTTSTKAIELSAPFRPLPTNFPEPYLEITALFGYIIYHGAG
jgi:hypothetical protein